MTKKNNELKNKPWIMQRADPYYLRYFPKMDCRISCIF